MACSCAASTISVPPTVITTTTTSDGDYVFLTGPLNTDNVLTLVVSLNAEAVSTIPPIRAQSVFSARRDHRCFPPGHHRCFPRAPTGGADRGIGPPVKRA